MPVLHGPGPFLPDTIRLRLYEAFREFRTHERRSSASSFSVSLEDPDAWNVRLMPARSKALASVSTLRDPLVHRFEGQGHCITRIDMDNLSIAQELTIAFHHHLETERILTIGEQPLGEVTPVSA